MNRSALLLVFAVTLVSFGASAIVSQTFPRRNRTRSGMPRSAPTGRNT